MSEIPDSNVKQEQVEMFFLKKNNNNPIALVKNRLQSWF